MIDDIREFWWSNITGPSYAVNQVARLLTECKNVALNVPSDLPWRKEMRGAILSLLRQRYANNSCVLETIDVADECPEDDPGMYLLSRYGDRDTRNDYREGSKYTIQAYLIYRKVLKDRIVWVKGMTPTAARRWIRFCLQYNSQSFDDGLFIVEIQDGEKYQKNDNIHSVDYLDFVSSFDVQVFCNYLLYSNLSYSTLWRTYISTLVANICGTDAQLAAALVDSLDFKKGGIYECLVSISQNDEFVKRGTNLDIPNVLTYVRHNNTVEVERRIWQAQIQVIYPLIELSRVSILEEHRERIQNVLDTNNDIIQYGNAVLDYHDVEIGALDYIVKNKHVFNDPLLKKKIAFLHDVRNRLAHSSLCSESMIDELFNYK